MEEKKFLSGKIRSPVVEGIFYPDNRAHVEQKIQSFGLERGIGGRAQAVIAPHGAWDISGYAAAAAFSAASGRGVKGVGQVVILGVIHRIGEEGIFLSDSSQFETPLGGLAVDRELNEELCSCSTLIQINDIPHLEEHSAEVLLPFVKYCFPNVSIIPILMGGSRPALISGLAHALRIVFEGLKEDTLFILSVNLAINNSEEQALQEALLCMELIGKKNAEIFKDHLGKGSISVCGGGIAASFLESGLASDLSVRLLSDPLIKTLGDDGNFVYYGALSFE
ncbi:MAG: AmmeMemoRadiSam system protein B [Treponema sp.]|jgi:AmmeMemoRadiSam system protein B|nr:AmmeMemoRadiSam system protein B [Treponema sp.]